MREYRALTGTQPGTADGYPADHGVLMFGFLVEITFWIGTGTFAFHNGYGLPWISFAAVYLVI